MPLIRVEATVNQRGFRAGQTRLVDSDQPRIQELLKIGFLVLVAPEDEEDSDPGDE